MVIGRSNIVGKPMAALLLRENGTVTVAHSRTADLKEVTRRADILIAAVGQTKMITAEYIKEGAVVIDVGMHRDAQNHLCGDVDFEDVYSRAICHYAGTWRGRSDDNRHADEQLRAGRTRLGGTNMRCTHCNAIIPEGWMRCPRCGKEVQIVPDYNPLDDVLTQEVKGSVEDVTRQLQTKDVRDFGRRQEVYQSKATRVLSQEELDEIQAGRERAARNRSRAEAKRKQQERKKQLVRRRRKVLLILFLVLLIFGAAFGYFLYQNSYVGKVAKGRCTADERISDSRKILQNMRLERMPRGQRHIPVWQRLIWNRMKGMRQNPYFFLLLLLIHPTKNCIGQQSAFTRRQSSLIRFPRFSRTAMTNPCFPV